MKYRYEIICRLLDMYEPEPLSEEMISEIRDHFGAIPKALEDYYRICGACYMMNAAQDYLLTIDGRYGDYKLKSWNYNDYCVFYVENQCVSEWAIRRSDLEQENPPVYETYDEGITWYKSADSVEEFLIAHGYLHAAFSFEYSLENLCEVSIEQVNNIFEKIGRENFKSSLYTGIWFIQNYPDTIIVILHEREGVFSVFYSSKRKEHFLETERMMMEILNE